MKKNKWEDSKNGIKPLSKWVPERILDLTYKIVWILIRLLKAEFLQSSQLLEKKMSDFVFHSPHGNSVVRPRAFSLAKSQQVLRTLQPVLRLVMCLCFISFTYKSCQFYWYSLCLYSVGDLWIYFAFNHLLLLVLSLERKIHMPPLTKVCFLRGIQAILSKP